MISKRIDGGNKERVNQGTAKRASEKIEWSVNGGIGQ